MTVSVILPSRGRPDLLERSITSLYEQAADQGSIEVLVGFDVDDAPTAVRATKLMEKGWGIHVVPFPERHGYHGLHHYVNELSAFAVGDWHLLWNDDATMDTPGWDNVVNEQDCLRPALLSPSSTGMGHRLSCFPIISRGWFKVTGHWSASPHNDSWVQDIARVIGIETLIPVHVNHHRFDLTGENDDAIWHETRAGYRPDEYNSPAMAVLRWEDQKKLTEALRR